MPTPTGSGRVAQCPPVQGAEGWHNAHPNKEHKSGTMTTPTRRGRVAQCPPLQGGEGWHNDHPYKEGKGGIMPTPTRGMARRNATTTFQQEPTYCHVFSSIGIHCQNLSYIVIVCRLLGGGGGGGVDRILHRITQD